MRAQASRHIAAAGQLGCSAIGLVLGQGGRPTRNRQLAWAGLQGA